MFVNKLNELEFVKTFKNLQMVFTNAFVYPTFKVYEVPMYGNTFL